MVKHFDPSCPKCKKKFHVHHEELRYAGIKLLCPYCQNEFFVDECDHVIEHDGTVTNPKERATRTKHEADTPETQHRGPS